MPEFDPAALDRSDRGLVPGGELMARALAGGGVDTLFTLSGGHILGLLDACPDAGIQVVDTRHEGAASLAAVGYALATGRTGVAAVTAGPGFGNAMTGLMDAHLGNTPMVLIGGRTGLRRQGRGAVMDIDQRAIATPASKAALTCYETDRIGEHVAGALWRARTGRPGAVYLEVPQDVLMRNGSPPDPAARATTIPRPLAAEEDVEEGARLLRAAERPIVIAGGGAFWSGAGDALRAFAVRAGAPVTTTSSARGLVPDDDEVSLGSLVHGGLAVPQADVVLIAGSAFDANLMYGRPPLFSAEQRIIQIDLDPGRIGGQRTPSIGLIGDCARVLEQLTAALEAPPDRTAWFEQARASAAFGRAMWDQQIQSHPPGPRVHAGAVARELAAFAHETGPHTMVADGGDALTWMLAYAQVEGPGRLLGTTTALGTLGVGLPFAVAAGVARPGEPVYGFIGDGTFGLCAMELETAARQRLPLICVVSNNAAWGDVAHEQDAWFGAGRHIASELTDARYEMVAQAFGGHGELVEDLDELRPALKRCLDAGEPSVVNVRTDPTVLSELLRNVGSLGLM